MLRTTVAGLRAHPLRLVLTAVVIVLAIGFTAGTLVLTDSLDRAGTDAVAAQARDVDLSVQSPDDADGYLDDATVRSIESVAGVDAAAPRREVMVQGVDQDGRIDPTAFAMVAAVPDEAALAGLDLTDGRLPERDDEVVLDARTADRLDLGVGDDYAVAPYEGEPVQLTVVGLAEASFGAGGSPELSATYAAVQDLADLPGAARVDVRLAAGADATAVRADLAAAAGTEVITGDALTDDLVANSSSPAKELRIPLLVLGAVSLIVAAFVIANTFRILVAQRTRELALLRTVGATRGQVMTSVLVESVVVGLLGSALGIGLGLAAAMGIGSAIAGGSADLPLVVSGSTLVASMVVGLAVTVGAALLPARAATRVAPLAAVRAVPDGADDERTGRVRRVGGVLSFVAGAGLLVLGAAGGMGQFGLVVVVLGATICFLGILVLGPLFVPPAVRLVGAALARLSGAGHRATTELATANAVRNPRRVAATSAALLIGVTMVSGFTTVADSARDSAVALVDEQFPSDFTVMSSGGEPVPDDVAAKIDRLPETGAVVAVYEQWAPSDELGGGELQVSGLDLGDYAQLTTLSGEGDPGAVTADGIAIGSVLAEQQGVGVGDSMTMSTPAGSRTLRIVFVADAASLPVPGIVVAPATFTAMFPGVGGPAQIAVDAADGVDAATARAAVVQATDGLTGVSVQSFAESREDLTNTLDQVINVVLAILGLAVVIAVIGIANTMSLSVHERTRELGLLRALGLTRSQTRGLLALEAVLMSVVAAVAGIVVGVAFALAAVASTPDLRLTIPWPEIVLCAVGAGVLGLLASVVPGRRAARVSPVVALATE